MTNLIIEISKYFMIFMFAFYTYECFAAFRQKIKPEQREHILSRQCAAIFLIHFDAFVVIYLVTEDISMLIFYAAQAVLLAKENAQKSAGVLFEKTMSENRQELKSACEKADFDCEILSQTADKNRSRVIDEAIKILAL